MEARLRIAIRADASGAIGHGHVMRCLTLADRLTYMGFDCVFVATDLPDGLQQKLASGGHKYRSIATEQDVTAFLSNHPFEWLIVDHYGIDHIMEAEWRAAGKNLKIAVIDDLANRTHDCDLLMDATPSREPEDYRSLVPEHATVLTGIDYALLRPEFLQARKNARRDFEESQTQQHVLVTLGGGDTSSELMTVGEALRLAAQRHDITVTLVGAAPAGSWFTVSPRVTAKPYSDDMAGEMAAADICVGAAGGTSWERCCLGLPTIALQIADNQQENAAFLEASETAVVCDLDADAIAAALDRLLNDRRLQQKLSERSMSLCDGKGASRVAAQLVAKTLMLRPATMEDAEFVYHARYDDNAARFYKRRMVPAYDAHVEWFSETLAAGARELLILSMGGIDIAHIRFDPDHEKKSAEISIALASACRGKGLAEPVLKLACQHHFDRGGQRIEAEVNDANTASKQLFLKSGFEAVQSRETGFGLYVLTAERFQEAM